MEDPYVAYYSEATSIASQLEIELKRLQRWEAEPLPEERYENMGAFGSNTMTFEQWLQFILIPTLHDIVAQGGNFPEDSHLATYAVRVWDGDWDTQSLQRLLQQLDDLIKSIPPFEMVDQEEKTETTTLGGTTIPDVVFELIEILPTCEGQMLEDQLQNYDIFLSYLSPEVRPQIADLLTEAAQKCSNAASKSRIEKASHSVRSGGPAGHSG